MNKPAVICKSSENPVIRFLKEIRRNGSLYLMALPGLLLLLLFNYLPLGGLIIAFKNFRFDRGILGSEWAQPIYNNFLFFFTSDSAFRVTRNTVLLNMLFIISGIILEVGFALMLNEIRGKFFKKVIQSFTFLPYFISWIVVMVFAYNIFNYENGMLNNMLKFIGREKVDWYSRPELWPVILMIVNRWKFTGYGMILYLATLCGIDPNYYEAAEIDGASRWRQIIHISIPMLMPTMTTITLLQVGRIMNADFGMFYALVGDNAQLFPTVDVLDTFIYRNLRKIGDVGMASAAGLYQSFVAFLLVLGSNMLARKYDRDATLF